MARTLALAFAAALGGAAPQDASRHPVVAGFDRFHADGADPAEGGRLLLAELSCVSCHRAEDTSLAPKRGPILTDAGSRLRAEWLRAWLADPHRVKPGTTMPDPGLAKDEVEPLVHFLMSLRAARPLPRLAGGAGKGKELFHRAGCAACHAPLDAADLKADRAIVPLGDPAAKYRSPAALAQFLLDPLRWRPSGRMPRMNLTPAEAVSVANHLAGHVVRPADSPADTVPDLAWECFEGNWSKLPDFDRLNPVAAGTTSKFDLGLAKRKDHVGLRFTGYVEVPRDGVYTFSTSSDDGSRLLIGSFLVVDNDGVHGTTEVSGSIELKKGKHAITVEWFEAAGGEELQVRYEGPGIGKGPIPAAALSRSRSGREPPRVEAEEPFDVDPARASKGRELFSARRCDACHEIDGKEKPLPAKPLAALDGAGGCLAGAPGSPRYSLSARQVGAIRAALRTPAPASTPAGRVNAAMAALNCYACHERGGRGGPGPARNALFHTAEETMGDEGRLPPGLDGVGAKLTRAALQSVLQDGVKVRPYMSARMPVFGPAAAGPLAEAFEEADRPGESGPLPMERDLIANGRLLVGTKGMSCTSCHTFRNYKAQGVQAMDLLQMPLRLRRDWFDRYMVDPAALRPGTRMPTFWPEGKSVRKDILGGDTEKQLQALWRYLAEGNGAQLPQGLTAKEIVLAPGDEPILYRNFIQGAGPRAIAVGYPERVNLAFDGNQMRLALLWQGDFIDAGKHWMDRGSGFQGPYGENIRSLPEGPPFARLADAGVPWPKETGRKAGYDFEGYELDAKRRPAFLYSFGGVQVRDHFEPAPPASFRRTLSFEAKEAPADLWVRAAAGRAIERMADGSFRLDGALTLRIEGAGAPVVRKSGSTCELLVPVPFSGGRARVVQHYAW